MRNILLTGVVLFGIAAKSYAQQAPADSSFTFSIQDCINYAYQHQHDVVNANLDVRSAEYHVKETIGQGLPQIAGSAGFQDYFKIPVTLIPGEVFGQPAGTYIPLKFGVTYQSNLTATANQIIFDPAYIIGLQGRKTYKELYVRTYQRSKIDANVAVRKAYYQILVSIEELRLDAANVKQLKQQVDETTARNKQGFVEEIDVDRITVQYNTTVSNMENARRTLALNYELLKFQMGMPIAYTLHITDKLESIDLNANVADTSLDSTVYRNRIEYNLLETQKRLNEYDVKLKIGQFLPSLKANASYAASYQNNGFGDLYRMNYPSGYVGLTLNVPIFTGWQHSNQLKQSRIKVMESENDLDNMRKTVDLQLVQSRVTFLNGLQSLNDQKKNIELAAEVLRVAKIKYEQGVGSSLEVNQAQISLQDADNSYIQGLYNALTSKVDLDKAYGRFN